MKYPSIESTNILCHIIYSLTQWKICYVAELSNKKQQHTTKNMVDPAYRRETLFLDGHVEICRHSKLRDIHENVAVGETRL